MATSCKGGPPIAAQLPAPAAPTPHLRGGGTDSHHPTLALLDTASDDLFAQYAATGNPRVRAAIVERHAGLARSLARRFANRGETHDDLVQVAMLGLLRAVDGFDPARNVQFSTYATATILGTLKRHFRDTRWSVRIPRPVQELWLALRDQADLLTNELGRSPTLEELAEALGVDVENVIEAMEAGRTFKLASLDASPGGEEPIPLGSADPAYKTADARMMLSPLIAKLAEREQQILHLRFVDDLSQSEIGRRVGLSQMHVSRLLARTLDRLRTALETGARTDDNGAGASASPSSGGTTPARRTAGA